ncbi:hypothetical protein P4U90_20815 [Cytobacillus kochii]|uniref:hypothetical protein n=1 Tax=Cytobacillus kochii TaxID=859143 RepID=UPI002E2431F3|nr:hypothetical protein [Cytobacillus kochii]
MSNYADVPKELVLNSEYTSRQIYLFMLDYRAIILSDNIHLTDDNEIKYKVIDIKEKYIHRLTDTGYRTQLLPQNTTKIYEIERI